MNDRQINLTETLIKASDAYYNSGQTIMSDDEYDVLLEELKRLEKQSGEVMSGSPTRNVGSVVSGISKVQHTIRPMLSADKCHTVKELEKFIGNQRCVFSCKMDGLSLRCIYKDGDLVRLETRGDGVTGGDVTFHKDSIRYIPKHIDKPGTYVVDGECIIPWDMFNAYNEAQPLGKKAANPRNLSAGSLNSLDSTDIKRRGLTFVLWSVIAGDESNSFSERLENASKLGFMVVPHEIYDSSKGMDYYLEFVKKAARDRNYPIDGAICCYDDVKYGESLGRTEKFFKSQIAYKYEDEMAETTLRDIEWNVSRNGVIVPVAIFDPVEIENSVVSRATLHNISIMEGHRMAIGDRLGIVKKNMIIPAVEVNLTPHETSQIPIPTICPSCGAPTRLDDSDGVRRLLCTNDVDCPARMVSRLDHFCSKPCVNVKGISEEVLGTFADHGWVKSFKDLYHLDRFKNEMINTSGLGRVSTDNFLSAIEKSRNTTLDRFLGGLGIPMIGSKNAKVVAGYFGTWKKFAEFYRSGKSFEASGLGSVASGKMRAFLDKHWKEIEELSEEFTFEAMNAPEPISQKLAGKTFVITGKLSRKRSEIEAEITGYGGKVAGAVSKSTDYLINNDVTSDSAKNKKAKELNIPIISEEDFNNLIK